MSERIDGQVPSPTPAPGEPVSTPSPDPNPAPTPTPGDPSPTPNPEPRVFDENYVKGLRTEAANYRTKAGEWQQKAETLEREKMSDTQKLTTDLEKYKTDTVPTLTSENRALRVQVAAHKLGIVDPDAASRLLDWSKIEAGSSVEDVLSELATARPWLKPAPATTTVPPVQTPQTPAPQITSPANPPVDATTPSFTGSQLRAMSQAEMSANFDAVQQAMAAGRVDYAK